MESEHVAITNLQHQIDLAYETAERFAADAGLNKKQSLQLRLLAEETLGLAMQIFGTAKISFWLDGDGSGFRVHLKTTKYLEGERKTELLSVSTTGENEAYKGFMGVIRGLFADPRELVSPWSLTDYRASLQSRTKEDTMSRQAAGDLERSIVANVADDVVVSMKDDVIQMVITKRIA